MKTMAFLIFVRSKDDQLSSYDLACEMARTLRQQRADSTSGLMTPDRILAIELRDITRHMDGCEEAKP